jgi:hypothetical protein
MKKGISYPNYNINTLLAVYPHLPKNSFAPCKFHKKSLLQPPFRLESLVLEFIRTQNNLNTSKHLYKHHLLELVDFL